MPAHAKRGRARKLVPSPFTVVVDTREQKPFTFERLKDHRGRPMMVPVKRSGLRTGDYSIRGLERSIVIERKSKADLYGTVGQGRKRFTRELERLTEFPSPAIVLECDFVSMLKPPKHTKVSPASVLASVEAWSVRYRIPVWMCKGRRSAEIVTYQLLRHYWNWRQREQ